MEISFNNSLVNNSFPLNETTKYSFLFLSGFISGCIAFPTVGFNHYKIHKQTNQNVYPKFT